LADGRSAWFETGENPLLSDSPAVWDRLIDAVGPPSLLVVIDSRMSATLKRRLTPEDIWQDTLLHAWRDRARCEWRGVRSFRYWLLTIIDHRIHAAAEHLRAAKRGGGEAPVPFSTLLRSASEGGAVPGCVGPITSTTPSRIAMHKEQAEAMQAALTALPVELRDVVRMRLFEQKRVEEIAERLEIGQSAVRHRVRKGTEIYMRRLKAELVSRSQASTHKTARTDARDSSPKG
jgi:RNA polymerase sigma-70 factor (ECF subfamily)